MRRRETTRSQHRREQRGVHPSSAWQARQEFCRSFWGCRGEEPVLQLDVHVVENVIPVEEIRSCRSGKVSVKE